MNDEQYSTAVSALIEHAKTIREIDIHGVLQRIKECETVAPIIDPTLYRRGAPNLGATKKLVESFLPVQVAFNELFIAVVETYSEANGMGNKKNSAPGV